MTVVIKPHSQQILKVFVEETGSTSGCVVSKLVWCQSRPVLRPNTGRGACVYHKRAAYQKKSASCWAKNTNYLLTECYRYNVYIKGAGCWPAPSTKSTGSQVGDPPLSFPDRLQSGHLLRKKNCMCSFCLIFCYTTPASGQVNWPLAKGRVIQSVWGGKSCEAAQPMDKQKSKTSSILLTDTPDVLIRHVNGLVWVRWANDSLSAEFLTVCLRPGGYIKAAMSSFPSFYVRCLVKVWHCAEKQNEMLELTGETPSILRLMAQDFRSSS